MKRFPLVSVKATAYPHERFRIRLAVNAANRKDKAAAKYFLRKRWGETLLIKDYFTLT